MRNVKDVTESTFQNPIRSYLSKSLLFPVFSKVFFSYSHSIMLYNFKHIRFSITQASLDVIENKFFITVFADERIVGGKYLSVTMDLI